MPGSPGAVLPGAMFGAETLATTTLFQIVSAAFVVHLRRRWHCRPRPNFRGHVRSRRRRGCGKKKGGSGWRSVRPSFALDRHPRLPGASAGRAVSSHGHHRGSSHILAKRFRGKETVSADMVLVQLKNSTDLLFTYETTTSVGTEQLITELVELVNARAKLLRLASACKDLIEHGPLKPEKDWGLTEEQISSLSLQDTKEPRRDEETLETVTKHGREWLLRADPTGRRIGEAPTEDMAEILKKCASEAESIVAKELATAGKGLTMAMIKEAMDNIRGAVMIIWPMGLPEYETVREIIDGTEDLTGTSHASGVMPPDSCLWWAGKEILRGKTLKDYVGPNEKTRIIAKLVHKGTGAPARENPMGEKAQKEMMAYYFRKQEEHKKLEENNEDDYLNSPWANPKALKANFNGVRNVSWRPT